MILSSTLANPLSLPSKDKYIQNDKKTTYAELKVYIDGMDADMLASNVKYFDEQTNSNVDVYGLTYFNDNEPSIILSLPSFTDIGDLGG